MVELPSGTVTFLFTDLEGSTRLWDMHPDAMHDALARHDEALRSSVEAHEGHVVKMRGDGVHAVFATASAAIVAAVAAQNALSDESWDVTGPLRVRIGIHTGTAALREGDYFGSALNRAARLMDVAHGGQIVCSQSTVDLALDALPDGVSLVDLGEHRLRDLTRAERIFQVSTSTLPSSFPALRSLESYPTNLPVQMTGFVGREGELQEAAAALDETRLITLTGVGGVGKTRLAYQVAAEALPEFRDGVFLVEFGGMNDATALEESVAAALLVQQQPGQTITETLVSFLGNKRLLLVLDNCEHLLDPIAQLVNRVLSSAPEIRVLATSREALRVDGEYVMTVPSLPVPDEDATLDVLRVTDAVRLFVARAHATRSDFALTADNSGAITQVCRRLDGIPLAIELAAARVRSMTPGEIAARLDQRFRLLTGGSRTAASRHQTLRSAIDWSYDALDSSEQALLGRLAICVGGFDLSAAEAIAAGDDIDALDVDDAVGRLVEKSLVHTIDVGEATRYKLLETIREYAMERLEASGETALLRTRHAAYYTQFAQQAGAGLKGPDERAWLTRVEDEIENLRAAVMWSLASGETHFACSCVCTLGLLGLRIEPAVSTWADNVVDCAAAVDDPAYPVALAVAGYARLGEGHREHAGHLCDAALARLDDSSSPAVSCRVFMIAAAMAGGTGRDPTEVAKQWVRAGEAAHDDYETALALNILSIGQSMGGDPAALGTAEDALRLARTCGSPSAIAYCLFTTAIFLGPTDPSRALERIDESQRNAAEAGNTFATLIGEGVRNGLLIQSGKYEAAARGYLEAAQRAFQYGRRDHIGPMVFMLAACLIASRTPEPGAVIAGWIDSLIGTAEPLPVSDLYAEPGKWIAQLPETLGAERYAALHASGAAMTAEEILEFARAQVDEGISRDA